ncbi:MAG TPA: ribosome small subunit-dependent GTPase A [Thermoanaerobaculia bacterium]|nr:ribosome small subunit-dependent GTPase A [Thermoanaerobaculia bacterium]
MATLTLQDLGFTDFFATAFEPYRSQEGLVPARVVAQMGLLRVSTGEAEYLTDLSGKLRHELKGPGGGAGYPAVGDWVVVRPPAGKGRAVIHAVLSRRSRFSRKTAGHKTEEQVVAANVDTIFLVSGLDGDYNPRRIERYLTAAWDSGAQPVIVLNKLDRCENPEQCLLEVEAIAMGVPVHAVSAVTGDRCEELIAYLGPGQTVGLLGSSGVGKSTLSNYLLGREVQKTATVREGDDRGRHTTTHRELFLTPAGGLLIDTPGLRELHLWEGGEGELPGIESSFSDVEELAARCRFGDCRHMGEPGCAVESGLPAERLESYRKLQRELRQLHVRQDELARLVEKKRVKILHKGQRQIEKLKGR